VGGGKGPVVEVTWDFQISNREQQLYEAIPLREILFLSVASFVPVPVFPGFT
jgi:hypothetical protein